MRSGGDQTIDERHCHLCIVLAFKEWLTARGSQAVVMLRDGSAEAQEYVTQLLRNLAQDPDNRSAIAKAGAVPELVKQLECGSEKAMGMAASGLALIALNSDKVRATVSNELVKQVTERSHP